MASIIIPGRNIPRRPTFGLPRLNRESPQAEGLVGWWPATEGAGNNLRDYTGSALPLDFNTSDLPLWKSTRLGYALDFGGSSDDKFAESSSVPWFSSGPWSVSCWIKSTASAGTNAVWALRNGTGAGDGQLFLLYPEASTNTARMFLSGAQENLSWSNDGDFHHFLFTTDNDTLHALYIDGGKWVGNFTTVSENVLNPTNFTVGAWRPTQQDFGGEAFDFRFYNHKASAIFAELMFDPATRWDLYAQEPRHSYIDIGVGPGTTIEIPSIGTPP